MNLLCKDWGKHIRCNLPALGIYTPGSTALVPRVTPSSLVLSLLIRASAFLMLSLDGIAAGQKENVDTQM